jgi:hypothetical protein
VRESRRAQQAKDDQINTQIDQTRRQIKIVDEAISSCKTGQIVTIGYFAGFGVLGAAVATALGLEWEVGIDKLEELKGKLENKLRAWEEEKMRRERERPRWWGRPE